MKKYRVLHLINSSGLGGAETIVLGILKQGTDYCFCLRKDEIKRFDDLRERIAYGTDGEWYKYSPFILLRLCLFIKKFQPDILHVHLGVSLFYARAVRVFFSKLTIIYHEHGEVQMNANLRKFIQHTHLAFNRFIGVSLSIKERLIKDCGIVNEDIDILPSYIDVDKFTQRMSTDAIQASKREQGINGKFVVGFAGRLIEIKGWREFVDAASIVAQKNPDVVFVVAGDGIDRLAFLQRVEVNGLKNRVVYLGYKTDMPEYYSILDCLCVPSHFEASPVSIIEAQAMALPVIASRISGIDEIINDGSNGILFEKGNAKDLAAKIITLSEDSDMRTRLAHAAEQSARSYSFDKYLDKLTGIYDRSK